MISHQALSRHLKTCLELAYQQVVLGEAAEVSVEDINLSLFLQKRVQDVDGSPMLNLDGLTADDKSAVVNKDGISYLKLDILKDVQEKLA